MDSGDYSKAPPHAVATRAWARGRRSLVYRNILGWGVLLARVVCKGKGHGRIWDYTYIGAPSSTNGLRSSPSARLAQRGTNGASS